MAAAADDDERAAKRPRADDSGDEAEEAGVDARAATTLVFLDPGAEGDAGRGYACHPEYTHQIFRDDRVEGYDGQ